MRGTNRKIQCKVGILHIALLREACLDHNMILSNFPQKLFWKPLQSLKLTMGRKSALLTRYLGRREIIRSKSNRTRPRNRSSNRHYYCHGKHHRTRLAKTGLPVHWSSTASREPVLGGNPSYDHGIYRRWNRRSPLSASRRRSRCCNASFRGRIRSNFENHWTSLGVLGCLA